MNIKITKEQHEELQQRTFLKVLMGSHSYKLDTKDSDQDYLCIYKPTQTELLSCVQHHHQLQYDDEVNNVDYIYTSLPQFFRNLISGDSTINFEVLCGNHFDYHIWFGNIHDIRQNFFTYTMIKSYLGLAKRDLKEIRTAQTDKEKYNKLMHVIRGTQTAIQIYRKTFEFDDFYQIGSANHNLLKWLKETDDKFYCDQTTHLMATYKQMIKDYRDAALRNVEKGFLKRTVDEETMRLVDEAVCALMGLNSPIEDLGMRYDAESNGIKY